MYNMHIHLQNTKFTLFFDRKCNKHFKLMINDLYTNLLIKKILNYTFNTLKNKNKINKNLHFHKNSESNLRSKVKRYKCSIK